MSSADEDESLSESHEQESQVASEDESSEEEGEAEDSDAEEEKEEDKPKGRRRSSWGEEFERQASEDSLDVVEELMAATNSKAGDKNGKGPHDISERSGLDSPAGKGKPASIDGEGGKGHKLRSSRDDQTGDRSLSSGSFSSYTGSESSYTWSEGSDMGKKLRCNSFDKYDEFTREDAIQHMERGDLRKTLKAQASHVKVIKSLEMTVKEKQQQEHHNGTRLAKIEMKALVATGAWIEDVKYNPKVRYVALILLFGYFLSGMLVFSQLEQWTYIDSLYFVIVTLTTVGYGDLIPSDPMSRIVVVFFAVVGLGLIAGLIGILGSYFVDKLLVSQEKANTQQQKDDRMQRELHKLVRSLGVMALLIGIGTVIYALIPGENKTVGECVYMSIMTATTVGYGTFHPETPAGRLVAVFWIPLSTGVTAFALGQYLELYMELRNWKQQEQVLRQELSHKDLLEADDDADGKVSQAEFVLFKLEKMGLVEATDINRIAAMYTSKYHPDYKLDSQPGAIDIKDTMARRENNRTAKAKVAVEH